jgi:hypothetical protein
MFVAPQRAARLSESLGTIGLDLAVEALQTLAVVWPVTSSATLGHTLTLTTPF